MTFSFHHEAEIELTEAVDYYENYETGLGYDFSIEVFTSIQCRNNGDAHNYLDI